MSVFDSIENAIEDYRAGKIVIFTDDEDRENEGDLMLAAEKVTPEAINFMAKHARGLICLPIEAKRLDEIGIPDMVRLKEDKYGTNFTVSVDAAYGITTGISARDRALTIEFMIDSRKTKEDIRMPGHIFPLRAKDGGVLVRAGHTEAAVDLARLAGLHPSGVICEIMNEDGSMARLNDLVKFKAEHNLTLCNISQLIEHRRRTEKLVECVAKSKLPTQYGLFDAHVYRSLIDQKNHFALVKGKMDQATPVLVRVHSECLTGDVFSSNRCDCGHQLDTALKAISECENGVLIYMRQEGRGIGLPNKVKAYALQDKGLDTVEANQALGFAPDLREYGTGAQILFDLGVRKIRLLTNNPKKIVGLDGFNLEVVERVPLFTDVHEHNKKYLETKQDKMGHLFDF